MFLFKLFFSLGIFNLGWILCLIPFRLAQSSCAERKASENMKSILCWPDAHTQKKKFKYPEYADFIDFTVAFDSISHPDLWKIFSHYGIPDKPISIIRILYVDLSVWVICGTYLTEDLFINTREKKGCFQSPQLFTSCIDWITTAKKNKKGISWSLLDKLEAKSRKYQGVFEVKSRVKTWQVRGIWSQQLEH